MPGTIRYTAYLLFLKILTIKALDFDQRESYKKLHGKDITADRKKLKENLTILKEENIIRNVFNIFFTFLIFLHF